MWCFVVSAWTLISIWLWTLYACFRRGGFTDYIAWNPVYNVLAYCDEVMVRGSRGAVGGGGGRGA